MVLCQVIFIFLQFLTSPEMSQRIYPEQSEQMYQLFRDISIDGFLNLEQFVPLAHKLLHTIYSLCYPEEVKDVIYYNEFLCVC